MQPHDDSSSVRKGHIPSRLHHPPPPCGHDPHLRRTLASRQLRHRSASVRKSHVSFFHMCINVEWRLWLSTHSFRTALLDVRFIYLTHIVIMHTFRAIRVARLAVHTPAVSTPSSTPLPTSGENPYSAAIEGLLHRNGTHHPDV